MADQPTKKSSGLLGLLALFVFFGAGAAIFYYSKKENHPLDISKSEFNVTSLPQATGSNASSTPASSVSPSKQTGLDMIKGVIPGLFSASKAKPTTADNLAAQFTALCRANEGKVQALAMAYTQRYPVIRQYGRDWMSYPDLKKLNDDYMKNHDPIAFLKGLSDSKNFGELVKKYAKRPEIRQFAQDAIHQAPPQLMSVGMGALSKDNIVKGVASNVSQALGLPPGLFNSLGGQSPQVDQKAIMNSVNAQMQQIQNILPQAQGNGQ